jgi:flavin reductase (DIM6/NTAB) family NADH-FMN oxidoreductase RutF
MVQAEKTAKEADLERKMISLVPDDLEPRASYRLMTSIVVPRPIAWVSTTNAEGVPNLAPFSFFNAVAGAPPVVVLAVGQRAGQPKDTLRNLRETGEMVVHLADEPLAEALNRTSADFPPGTNEFERAGLASVPSTDIQPPRVSAAPVAMEARLLREVAIPETRYTVLFGRIIRLHIREELLGEDGLVVAERLRPIARLGRDEYTTLGEVFAMPRPRLQ